MRSEEATRYLNRREEWSDPDHYIHVFPEQHVSMLDIRADASGPIELLEVRLVRLFPLIGLIN